MRIRVALRWLIAVFGIVGAAEASATGYYVQNGKVYDAAGQQIQVRGISHFGFNADILQPEFLWAQGWKEQIAQIKALGFNAVRVPFVPDTLYVTTTVDKLSYVDASKNPEFIGKTPLQALDLWMAEADRQGLYVLLDFHSVSKVRQYPTWYLSNSADFGIMYNGAAYTEANWIRDLTFVAKRYANLPHFFGIDLYNEPNGVVRWSTGDPNMTNAANFWKAAAERAGTAVLQANPNLLIFMQGIAGNFDGVENSSIPVNWGEDFQPEAYQPSTIPDTKLVLTPHTYGPDVYQKSSFSAANFPANLAANWEALFGKFYPAHAVITGEWGGKYGNGTGGAKDITWQNAYVDYLLSKGIRDTFYWCYTPNSGDSGGILDDNLNVRTDKMALLQRLWGGTAGSGSSSGSTSGSTGSTGGSTTPAPTPGSVGMTASSYTVAQSAGKITITVNRSGGSSGAASVRYATGDGTGKAGTDYTASSGTLSWASGDAAAKTFTVPVITSPGFTGTRTFTLALSAASGASMATATSATVSITGSGAPASAQGSLQISAASYSVTQSATSVSFTVTRTGGKTGSVSVHYATADGSAKSGTDYTAKSGTLTWLTGSTATRTVTVTLKKTAAFSGTRSFTLNLSAATGGAVLGMPATATVTITGSLAATTPTSGTLPQQLISSFSPNSGKVGTVVTINGSGFTGTDQGWVGAAHNAVVQVMSDTQMKVTIPSGATTGAIGVLNALHAAFTPTAFTVTN